VFLVVSHIPAVQTSHLQQCFAKQIDRYDEKQKITNKKLPMIICIHTSYVVSLIH